MHHITTLETLARIMATVILCAIIGLERESRDQAAGVRTHVLVGLGACLFTLVSAYGFTDAVTVATTTTGQTVVGRDPTRIAAQIVSGIGFLGAGAIIRQGFNVRGLTTAATLWIVAALGMACGAGYYIGALLATAVGMIMLVVFRKFRPLIMSKVRTDFIIFEFDYTKEKQLRKVFSILASGALEVEGIRTAHQGSERQAIIELHVPPGVDAAPIMADIMSIDDSEISSIEGFHAPSMEEIKAINNQPVDSVQE